MPGEAIPRPDFLNYSFIDLIVHLGIFIVFSFLLTGALYYNKKWDYIRNRIVSIVVIGSLLFSLLTEFGQIFIPGRFFHILDIIMNFLGSLIGMGVFFLKFKYFSK